MEYFQHHICAHLAELAVIGPGSSSMQVAVVDAFSDVLVGT